MNQTTQTWWWSYEIHSGWISSKKCRSNRRHIIFSNRTKSYMLLGKHGKHTKANIHTNLAGTWNMSKLFIVTTETKKCVSCLSSQIKSFMWILRVILFMSSILFFSFRWANFVLQLKKRFSAFYITSKQSAKTRKVCWLFQYCSNISFGSFTFPQVTEHVLLHRKSV